MSLMVIFRQNWASLPGGSAYALTMQYSGNFTDNWKQLVTSYLVFFRQSIVDNAVKFSDPRLNRSRQIQPKASEYGISDDFSRWLPTGSS